MRVDHHGAGVWAFLLSVFVLSAGGGTGAPALAETGVEASADTTWAWGSNENGRLGDGTTAQRYTPGQVLGPGPGGLLTDVVELSAGEAHTLARRTDNTLWAWGANWGGQLGDGTQHDRYTPVQVVGPDGIGFLSDIIQVSGGIWHTLALRADGTAWAWGNNYAGALGDGTVEERHTPVQVRGPGGVGFLTDVVQVSAGGGYSLALTADGTVWGWGENWAGQLGDGTTDTSLTPVAVRTADGSPLAAITQVSAHRYHSLALGADGRVYSWGENWAGQLGDGTTTPRPHAGLVSGPGGSGTLSGILQAAAGDSHSIARAADGTVWTWGKNEHGQLGDGTTTDRHTPVKVVGENGEGHLEGIIFMDTGEATSFALTAQGIAWAWGYNGFGNLGDGTLTERHTPVRPVGITAVSQVSVAWRHTVAVGQGVLPGAPRDLTARPGDAIEEITLQWDRPLYTSGPLLGYRLYRATAPDGPYELLAELPPTAWQYTDTGSLLTTYHYEISARNAVGEGEASETACTKPYPWVSLEGNNLCALPSPP